MIRKGYNNAVLWIPLSPLAAVLNCIGDLTFHIVHGQAEVGIMDVHHVRDFGR